MSESSDDDMKVTAEMKIAERKKKEKTARIIAGLREQMEASAEIMKTTREEIEASAAMMVAQAREEMEDAAAILAASDEETEASPERLGMATKAVQTSPDSLSDLLFALEESQESSTSVVPATEDTEGSSISLVTSTEDIEASPERLGMATKAVQTSPDSLSDLLFTLEESQASPERLGMATKAVQTSPDSLSYLLFTLEESQASSASLVASPEDNEASSLVASPKDIEKSSASLVASPEDIEKPSASLVASPEDIEVFSESGAASADDIPVRTVEVPLKSTDEIRKLVDRLFSEKEHFYELHPNATVEAKKAYIRAEMMDLQDMIDRTHATYPSGEECDMLMFLRAKLYSLFSDNNSEVLRILTRHVKFYPAHWDAWNVLAETYWKQRVMPRALDCFFRSIEMKKNSHALRCVSMIYRGMCGTEHEVSGYMSLSLTYAHKACEFDVTEGKNWYSLGNVYVSTYFKCDQDPDYLRKALKAYMLASHRPDVKTLADFHYNRAMAYRHIENYDNALFGLRQAAACDPNWDDPKIHHDNLLAFLKNCMESIRTKGKVKPRDVHRLLKSLKLSDIGPYAKGYVRSTDDEEVQVKLKKCPLSRLELGNNLEKLVCGKVVCHIYSADPVTFAFCMIDDTGPCYAVHVYNISARKGVKIGDSVAIPEPLVQRFDFTYGEDEFKYQWIKVMDPLVLVVNGNRVHPSTRCKPYFNIVFSSEL